MTRKLRSVKDTVAFRPDKMFAELIPGALVLLLLGLAVLAFVEDRDTKLYLASGILIAASLGFIAFALYRQKHPSEPLIMLSPEGVKLRILSVKTIDIPWSEVRGVGVRDIRFFYPSLKMPRTITYHDVTTLRVSKDFYEKTIYVDSLFMRGPGWSNNFIEEDDHVAVALHHELVSVKAEDMHGEVVSRWRAFGSDGARATADPVSFAERRKWRLSSYVPALPAPLASVWSVARYALPLAGVAFALTNLLGLWTADYQKAERAKQTEWRAQLKTWEDEEKKSAKERAERDAKFEKMFKDMDVGVQK